MLLCLHGVYFGDRDWVAWHVMYLHFRVRKLWCFIANTLTFLGTMGFSLVLVLLTLMASRKDKGKGKAPVKDNELPK